ncbi:MAG: ASCH domain-containing protein [Chloroflexi bacterium]|nr:ASCH domain-containing protein [Chloroflexota bacterium]
MKAFTLTQPWATLVAIGAKTIETRSWRTNYRGHLAIHAAKTMGEDDFYLIQTKPFFQALENILDLKDPRYLVKDGKVYGLPLGCVIATCELVQCFIIHPFQSGFCPEDHSKWVITHDERSFGDYTPGRYAWILENVKPLPEPIPAKGALGLWNWDEK